MNVFEPRYRLMIRRAMEGNRRIGMAQGRGRDLDDVFTEAREDEEEREEGGRLSRPPPLD